METPGLVSDILRPKSNDLYTVKAEEPVYNAILTMAKNNVGALLVLKGKKLKGILTERDYTRKVIIKGRSSKKITVGEIMTEKVLCVSPSTSISEALRMMTGEHIRHLPVVDGDHRPVGMLSVGDLVKWIISVQDSQLNQMESYVTSGGYPG